MDCMIANAVVQTKISIMVIRAPLTARSLA
jgi:hypothetical protein